MKSKEMSIYHQSICHIIFAEFRCGSVAGAKSWHALCPKVGQSDMAYAASDLRTRRDSDAFV